MPVIPGRPQAGPGIQKRHHPGLFSAVSPILIAHRFWIPGSLLRNAPG
jgi:hypothetical protein